LKLQVWLAGSPAVATLEYTTCLKFEPFGVLETTAQPEGAATVGAALTSTTATIASPARTPAGTGIVTLVPTLLAPVEAPRSAIPVDDEDPTVIATVAALDLALPSSTV
jgi:hypothetical protein